MAPPRHNRPALPPGRLTLPGEREQMKYANASRFMSSQKRRWWLPTRWSPWSHSQEVSRPPAPLFACAFAVQY
jgi:hypothetical protein